MAQLDQPAISIYDKDGHFLDWLRAPVSYRITPRHITAGVGDAEIVVQGDDYRGQYLWQPGSRIKISLRGSHVLGGRTVKASLEGPQDSRWVFSVMDDAVVLDEILAWPNPGNAITAQTSRADLRSGPLESVAKSLIAANAAKQGLSIGIATDQGRGPTVNTSARMVPLRDVLIQHFRDAGMNLVAVWDAALKQVVVDVTTPASYPIVFHVAARQSAVTAYRVTRSAPTITRVVMGDGGNDTTRTFARVTNATAEADWGISAEAFRAAATTTDMNAAGTEALTDGGPKSGLTVSLTETDTIRYGGPTGLHVGDLVTIHVGDIQVTDTVREVVISGSPGQPLTVKPGVGGWEDNPSHVLTEAVRRMGTAIRRVITH